MRREDLERFLERGNELGFIKDTDREDYLGWILVRKEKPNRRILELFSEDDDETLIIEQREIHARPYVVRVAELSREAHESDRYEANEDYRMNQNHRFATLDEVEAFVRQYGHTLEQIKWRIELDAP